MVSAHSASAWIGKCVHKNKIYAPLVQRSTPQHFRQPYDSEQETRSLHILSLLVDIGLSQVQTERLDRGTGKPITQESPFDSPMTQLRVCPR
jgi:hypothetical protein